VYGIEMAIDRAAHAIDRCDEWSDPLFGVAVLRGHRFIGRRAAPDALLESWRPWTTRLSGAIRYRWAIDPRFAGPLPTWVGAEPTWRPWHPRAAEALDARPDTRWQFVDRLLTPIVLADVLDMLDGAAERGDDIGDLARDYLDEAMPKVRRDAAAWVAETHAWTDTWALRSIARRSGALRRLHPFALAIADAYAATAQRSGNVVLGTRYPFHDMPLVSASSHLAGGLAALGVHAKLVGALAEWVRGAQHHDGGWGDTDGPSDPLTTLVASDLLATLDPTFDPASAAAWFSRCQRDDGWWRAYGPEATWLSVEILAWLQASIRPFDARFRWPNLALANRDRRTGLPFYAYFADLARLFGEVRGLSSAAVEVAFIDLAGFGTFNNAHGMAMGDRALTAFARALNDLDTAIAIRDGGDEFLVVAAPGSVGLPERLATFRASWPERFRAEFGTTGVVAPRILTVTTRGDCLIDARDELGIAIAALKRDYPVVGWEGVQRDLGRLL